MPRGASPARKTGTLQTDQAISAAGPCEDTFTPSGAPGAEDVRFVDDNRYQDNLGNVHCATNTLKAPMVADFSKALPALA